MDWPRHQPSYPSFGPKSAVKVSFPWKDKAGDNAGGCVGSHDLEGKGGKQMSPEEATDSGSKRERPRRTTKFHPTGKEDAEKQKEEKKKRKPVNQRWFYEPVLPTPVLSARPVTLSGKEDNDTQSGGDNFPKTEGRIAVRGRQGGRRR